MSDIPKPGDNPAAASSAWRQRYDAHIHSPQWANMRRDLIKLRGNRCERCGYQTSLALHHKTYERLGRELTSDLELLCAPCHDEADKQRAQRGAARSQAARYNAALDTYATKKYGENWQMQGVDFEGEFDQWLESKE